MNYKLSIICAGGDEEYTVSIDANTKRDAFRLLERQSIEGYYLIKGESIAIPKSSVRRIEIKEKVRTS